MGSEQLTVKDYLKKFVEIGEAAFVKQYNHPFLLHPEQASCDAFATFHTRMADRGGGARIADHFKGIHDYQVLVPTVRPGKSLPKKLMVGRTPDRDIFVDHATVSKRHAYILFDLSSWSYKLGDAGSTNGTSVNGMTVHAESVELRDGNVVSFGKSDFLFFTPQGFADLLKRLQAEK